MGHIALFGKHAAPHLQVRNFTSEQLVVCFKNAFKIGQHERRQDTASSHPLNVRHISPASTRRG